MKREHSIKILEEIYTMYPDRISDIITESEKVGLNRIDFSQRYDVIKLSAKNKSDFGYPDKMDVVKNATVKVVGVEKYVWLAFISYGFNNYRDWWKTSPVVSCKKTRGGYRVETQNSIYRLKKVVDK